jgi:membrane protein DedA with SNARE-associated domain
MLEEIIIQLQSMISDYGAIGLLISGIVKEFIPIPSTAIIIGTSFLLLKGQAICINSILNLLFIIVIPLAIGMTIGAIITYMLCFYIGKPFIDKWGKYISLRWEDIKKMDKKFENTRKDYIILYLLRTTPIIPSVIISAFCGIIRYDFRKYLIITFLGGLTRAIVFGFIGWQFGNLYDISNQIPFLGEIVTLII